jgi:hypothetical protein
MVVGDEGEDRATLSVSTHCRPHNIVDLMKGVRFDQHLSVEEGAGATISPRCRPAPRPDARFSDAQESSG